MGDFHLAVCARGVVGMHGGGGMAACGYKLLFGYWMWAYADPSWTLDLLQPRVVHGGRMKCRHKPNILQTHHELFPTHTGVMRCIAQPRMRGSTTTKRASDSTNTNTP